jgi:hypothetical protein
MGGKIKRAYIAPIFGFPRVGSLPLGHNPVDGSVMLGAD